MPGCLVPPVLTWKKIKRERGREGERLTDSWEDLKMGPKRREREEEEEEEEIRYERSPRRHGRVWSRSAGTSRSIDFMRIQSGGGRRGGRGGGGGGGRHLMVGALRAKERSSDTAAWTEKHWTTATPPVGAAVQEEEVMTSLLVQRTGFHRVLEGSRGFCRTLRTFGQNSLFSWIKLYFNRYIF